MAELKFANDLWGAICNTVGGQEFYTVRADTAEEYFSHNKYVNVTKPYAVIRKQIIE